MKRFYRFIFVGFCTSFLVLYLAYGKVIKKEEFIINKTKNFTHKAVIYLYDSPILNMYWVKLEKGGYKVSGSISEVRRKLSVFNNYPNCEYLTDLSIDELKDILLKNYGYVYKNIYVKNLNSVVEINKEPFLYNPYRPNINPTTTLNLFEINRQLKRIVKVKLKKDKKVKKLFKSLKESYIKAGYSEKEADRQAKIYIARYIKPEIKKWISEDRLPRELYLVCRRSFVDFNSNETLELHLFPVKLRLKSDKSVEIINIKKGSKDIELTIIFHPEIFTSLKNKRIPLDLITLNPVEIKDRTKHIPENLRKCPHLYIGAIPYYGKNPYKENYQIWLSFVDNGFYLIILPYEATEEYKVYIRLGYYCSYSKKDRISLLNPTGKDFAPLTTIYQEFYNHRDFLNGLNIDKLELKLKFVSPTGYKSKIFKVNIP